MSLVVDSTVALAWCLEDTTSGHADLILALLDRTEAAAPAHWPLEVLGGLMSAAQRGHITSADVDRLITALQALPIEVAAAATGPELRVIQRLGGQYHIGPLDAAYLELALRKGSQLITMDPDLAEIARAEGIGG